MRTEAEVLADLKRLNAGKIETDKLATYDGSDKMLTSHEMRDLIEMRATYNPTLTGFTTLDAIMEGFYPGELIVVSGPTGQGKTTICQAFTRELCSSNVPVAWFSYEVGLADMFRRFGSDLPLFAVPRETVNGRMDWLQLKIRESKAKYGTRVVFVDHLHYLIDMSQLAQAKSTSILIGMLMRELKRFAVDEDITIFLISHIKKTTLDAAPTIEDLRDCLPAGQLVYVGGQRIPVEKVRPGNRTVSYRNIKKLQEDTITDVWKVGLRDILKITTKTGRAIECSTGHRFYATSFLEGVGVFGPNQKKGIRGWTRADDLKVGQKIAVVKKYPKVGKATLTKEQCLLLGWLIGDGHITKQGYSEITCNTKEEAEELRKLAFVAFGLLPAIRPYKDKNALRVYMTGDNTKNKLARFLRSHGITHTKQDKRVPEIIFSQDAENIQHFLRGLFHADGSASLVGKKEHPSLRVILSTISKTLASDTQHLLLRLGLLSYVSERNYKSGWTAKRSHIYEVNLGTYNAIKFVRQVGFLLNKQAKAEEKSNRCASKHSDKNMDIYFDKVVSIESVGKKECYDLSVQGHHKSLENNSFCVNDILTHNSSFIGQESDFVLMLWRLKRSGGDEFGNDSMVRVEKNRRTGKLGSVRLTFRNGGLYECT